MNSNHSGSSRRSFSRGSVPRHRQRMFSHNNSHSHNDNYQQQRNYGQWYKDSEPCYSHR